MLQDKQENEEDLSVRGRHRALGDTRTVSMLARAAASGTLGLL